MDVAGAEGDCDGGWGVESSCERIAWNAHKTKCNTLFCNRNNAVTIGA